MVARAIAAFRAGDAESCLALCRSVLASAPTDPQAGHLEGLALARLGRMNEAIESLERATKHAPGNADLAADFGRALAATGRFDEAAQRFAQALSALPQRVDIRDDYATALACLERFDEASREWQRVLAEKPAHASARLKLARLHALTGNAETALRLADEAVRDDARSAARAAIVRGIALISSARYAEAETAFAMAIDAGEKGEALVGRARARLRIGKIDGARRDAEAAIATRPQDEDAAMVLARATREMSDLPAAAKTLGRLIALRPQSLRARWARINLIDPVPPDQESDDAARAEWMAAVRSFDADLKLDTPQRIAEAFVAIQEAGNFHLHYQRDDNLEAQELYGALLHRIAAARLPAHAKRPQAPSGRQRPRIGFISAFLRQHSIWKIQAAWITGTAGFEKYVYYAGTPIEDGFTTVVRDAADAFFHLTDVRQLADLIASHQLDMLIWLDHGMAIELQGLAALWLAPLQANGLGHPITSGLPTMTHALTSALMEPENGDSQYSERLWRLDGTAYSFSLSRIERLLEGLPPVERDLDRIDYFCAQNLAKYRPRHDRLFAEIAARLPAARFNFVGDKKAEIAAFRHRLEPLFRRAGLDVDRHCVFHGPQMPPDYMQLNRRCAIFLDSLGWSGNNTTHEAIACGLPVVTCPGETMRSRHGAAILTRMGLTETIAADSSAYVDMAVSLGSDSEWRRHLAAETIRRRPQLFDDPAPLRSLERFVAQILENPA